MKCPSCSDTTLALSERQGIEIDYCPQCRGVWLDRGELDKLIERADRAEGGEAARTGPPPAPAEPPRRQDWDEDWYRGRKRKSFLRDLFD